MMMQAGQQGLDSAAQAGGAEAGASLGQQVMG